jgi:hypothetical protein
LLEPSRSDRGDHGQARSLRRFPVRRQRRLPGLHRGLSALRPQELRLRRLLEDRGPGRGGQALCRGQDGRAWI